LTKFVGYVLLPNLFVINRRILYSDNANICGSVVNKHGKKEGKLISLKVWYHIYQSEDRERGQLRSAENDYTTFPLGVN
jgi:hypothetical protein